MGKKEGLHPCCLKIPVLYKTASDVKSPDAKHDVGIQTRVNGGAERVSLTTVNYCSWRKAIVMQVKEFLTLMQGKTYNKRTTRNILLMIRL
ncbi:hypothetical protein [Rivularia sp. PCC 7116]|uniref:hypothetical protein n=1 Tax=Rivularia sp. PCC 7116 TaxID=373994 RepID=UPI0005C7E4CD|nr:hypothetical protein [Rivularia sp. PCC 7116]